MRKSTIAVALCLLSAAPAGAAGDPRVSSLEAANVALATEYKFLMAQQGNGRDKAALRDLERAWIGYKDKQCLFEVGAADGTAQRPGMALWSNYADCELRVTKARAQELKSMECAGVSVCARHIR
jgi:uncharacterized protein YecT (DUF1311 family)